MTKIQSIIKDRIDIAHDTIPHWCDWSQHTFIVHIPIDNSTHNPAFYTVVLHCQTHILMPACQSGKQLVPSWRYDKDRRELYQCQGTSEVATCFLSAWHWAVTARPDPTGLPVFLSIATCVEFQINLANFSGKLLDQVSLGTKKTNYGTFKKLYIIHRCISLYAKLCASSD